VNAAGPLPARILAVDYGDRRTGLAATDWTGTICVPLPRLELGDAQALAAAIGDLVRERQTQLVVVGMPLLQDGQSGQRAQRTQSFVAVLASAIAPVPVATIDESHSTDEAHERLKQGGLRASRRKDLADSIAALVILERYRAGRR
jgi:putative Holliday junction resolvase